MTFDLGNVRAAARPTLALALAALTACSPYDGPSLTPEADTGGTDTSDETPDPSPMSVTIEPKLLRLVRPQALSATITIDRRGRAGDTAVEIVDLPAGVMADPVTIPADATSVSVVIRAVDAAAYGGPTPFRVRATIAGETIETTARLVVAGGPGAPDTSFGDDGQISVSLATVVDPRVVALGPNGEIYVSGSRLDVAAAKAFMLRLTPRGELDTTFGDGGKVEGIEGAVESSFASMIPLPGKLLVVSMISNGSAFEFDVRRLGESGALDTTFGAGGRTLMAGSAREPLLFPRPSGGFFANDGTTVTAFDDAGVLDGSFQASGVGSRNMALDEQKRIVTCANEPTGFILRRFLPTGAPDPSFGTNGVAEIPSAAPACRGVYVQTGGRVVFGGWIQPGLSSEKKGILGRTLEDGTLDPSFGESGFRTIEGGTDTAFGALGLAPDEKIVTLGHGGATLLRRFTADGAVDSSFGILSSLGLTSNYAQTLVIDRDAGRVVVAGVSTSSTDSVRVRRYWL